MMAKVALLSNIRLEPASNLDTWQAALLLPRGDEQCWMSLEQMAEVRPASERHG